MLDTVTAASIKEPNCAANQRDCVNETALAVQGKNLEAVLPNRKHFPIDQPREMSISRKAILLSGCVVATLLWPAAVASAEAPDTIAVKGETLIVTIHAQGAQVYECKLDTAGKLAWEFREPIATLMADGKTVGRHFAGPSWELGDGSLVHGKLVARTSAATPMDIPLLKLDAIPQRDGGLLAGVTTIQRLNTKGGTAQGPCEVAGSLLSVPYSADYAFYRKPRWSLVPEPTRNEMPRNQGKN